MARSVVLSLIACALAVPLLGSPAAAQEALDAQVVRAVAAIEAELAAFNLANRSTPEPLAAAPAPRAARHVVYKARDLLGRVQMLRRLNGIEEQPVPNAPVKAMDAADAKEIVDKVAATLRDLRPAFGNPPIRPIPSATGGTATDAYAGLLRAERALRALDMPAIVPNEVYRIALQAASDVERIAAARGRTAVAPAALPPGMTPREAYDAAYALIEEIKRLSDEVPAFAVPGGIVLPTRETGDIRPETVVDLLTAVVADLSAVKVKAGVTQPTRRVPTQAGKTPADTVAALRAASATVAALREAGS